MGFSFRRSIRILPGVRLNISRSGVSTSVGGQGASITVGKRGVRANGGLTGAGRSYSTRLDNPKWARAAGGSAGRASGSSLVGAVVILVFVATCVAALAGS